MRLQQQAIDWLAQQDMAIYLVGGCVRDLLLGRAIYDLDVAVDGDALGLARRMANSFHGAYYPLDEVRDTGRAILRTEDARELVVDVAHLRGADLGADLADRDFTINAMATDVRAPEEVIDRHGGLADLQTGTIRPVSEASIRNDPLRALRAIRQAAQLGFDLAPETRRLIRRDGAGLSQVSNERIRDEVARLVVRDHATLYLRWMDELNLLTLIVPELEALRGLEQSFPHHLTGLDHSLAAVEALEFLLDRGRVAGGPHDAPVDPRLGDALAPLWPKVEAHVTRGISGGRIRLVTLKLAALLHDTGKPATLSVDETGRTRFTDHERGGAEIAGAVLARLRFTNTEVRLGEAIVRHHMRPLHLASQERVSTRAVYRFFRDTEGAGIEVLLHALADHRAIYAPGSGEQEWSRLTALAARMLTDYFERPEERVAPPRLITGTDLMGEFGLDEGPQIGDLLEAVREAQVSGEVSTREQALALVRDRLA